MDRLEKRKLSRDREYTAERVPEIDQERRRLLAELPALKVTAAAKTTQPARLAMRRMSYIRTRVTLLKQERAEVSALRTKLRQEAKAAAALAAPKKTGFDLSRLLKRR